jgi:hypothetical protein
MASNYPDIFIDKATEVSKKLNVVVCIEGLDQCISLVPTYKKIRYGDPGVNYGTPGLVWGGLMLDPSVRVGLSIESDLTISQRLEPEQGRGSVSTMRLGFVDLGSYFSKLITPGQFLDDILGNKLFKVKLGYQETSYPEDYFTIFRGYASETTAQSGKITIQLSDSNLKRRSQIFPDAITKTTSSISAIQTTIPVVETSDFCQQIQGPDLFYDSDIKTFIKIDDEIMEYGPTGLAPTQITVTRAQRGTAAATHDIDADVTNYIEIQGNIIDIALKIMLSGWQGPWIEDVEVDSLIFGGDYGNANNLIRFPDNIDIVDVYGITENDAIYITGSTAGNDGEYRVQSITSSPGRKNNILLLQSNLVAIENPATSVRLAFRSQFDVYPENCGLKMKPNEIDVNGFVDLRNQFLSTADSNLRFFLNGRQGGKEFIEKELLLVAGAYSITKFGKISLRVTLPPFAGSKLVTLDNTNVLNPQNVIVKRALNNRRFFNEVVFYYDKFDLEQDYAEKKVLLDSDSLNIIGINSTLPIQSKGLRTDLGAESFTDRRGKFILNRYKNAAYEIDIQTNFGTGSQIESGDVIAVKDNGILQITNLSTGERNLGYQLFEVIDRKINLVSGVTTLKLLSNTGYDITDRYGTYSPSSHVAATGSTVSKIKIVDSYGSAFPGDEKSKWVDMVGEEIEIHKKDYSQRYVVTLVGFDGADPYMMNISPNLPVVPDDTWVINVPEYSENTSVYFRQVQKTLYAHHTPAFQVVAGISNTVFTINLSEIPYIKVGLPILIRSTNWGLISDERKVKSININQVEVDGDLGFTPSAGQYVELIGFIDGGGPYRFI